MDAFVEDLKRSGEKHGPEKFADFRKVLERVEAAPNSRYFICKCIILNNLFGVESLPKLSSEIAPLPKEIQDCMSNESDPPFQDPGYSIRDE